VVHIPRSDGQLVDLWFTNTLPPSHKHLTGRGRSFIRHLREHPCCTVCRSLAAICPQHSSCTAPPQSDSKRPRVAGAFFVVRMDSAA